MKISYPHPENHFTTDDYNFLIAENRESYSLRPSIYLLLLNEDDKLATINYREEIGPMYPFPGGGVDEGESWEEGLVREIKEEIGCSIEKIKSIGSFDSYNDLLKRMFQSIICTAKLVGKPGKTYPVEDYEQGSELVWLTKEEALLKLRQTASPSDNLRDCRSQITLEIIGNSLMDL
jgi:8-oxo-dGTP diphosphatase